MARTIKQGSSQQSSSSVVDSKLFILAACIIIILIYSSLWYCLWCSHQAQLSSLGQLGDSFAPITGCFSTLTILILLLSYRSQREELRNQREELEQQRQVLQEQQKEMIQSRLVQERQAEAQLAQARQLERSIAQDKVSLKAQMLNLRFSVQSTIMNIELERRKLNYDHALRINNQEVLSKAVSEYRESFEKLEKLLKTIATDTEELYGLLPIEDFGKTPTREASNSSTQSATHLPAR